MTPAHYKEIGLDTHPGVSFILRIEPDTGAEACVGVTFGSDPAIMVSQAEADAFVAAPWEHARNGTVPRLHAEAERHPAGEVIAALGNLSLIRASERVANLAARIEGYLNDVRSHMGALRRRTSTHVDPDLAPRLWAHFHPANQLKNNAHQTVAENVPDHMRAPLLDADGDALGEDATGDQVVQLRHDGALLGWFKVEDLTRTAEGEVAPHWMVKAKHHPRWSVDPVAGSVTLSVNGAHPDHVAALHQAVSEAHGERVRVIHHRDH